LASKNRVAGIDSACLVIKASDGCIHATNSSIAGISGASVVIITVKSGVDSVVVASLGNSSRSVGKGCAKVNRASISVVTILGSVYASVGGAVTAVVRANVAVVTVEGSGNTGTSERVALLGFAGASGTDNSWRRELALVAINSSILATR
jgi:hypothetical protein